MADKKTFKEIFDFEPNGGELAPIETAIVLASLKEFARLFFVHTTTIREMVALYAGGKSVADIGQALSDLKTVELTIKVKDSSYRKWEEAVKEAKANGYAFSETIEDYRNK